MSDPDTRRPSALLTMVRETPRYHWLALVVACLLGLVASTFHWSGLVFGGALVGALADDLKRAVLSGVGFGLLTIVVWAALILFAGNLGKLAAMNEIALLPVGITLGLSILGSLFRGTLS